MNIGCPADESCEDCAKIFDSLSSICSHCGEEVTNGAFFKKTSPHFKLTCKAAKAYPALIPEQSWKRPLPYPMPAKPKYDMGLYHPTGQIFINGREIASIADLCAYWGLPAVSEYPDDSTEKLIAALETQNALLKQLAA